MILFLSIVIMGCAQNKNKKESMNKGAISVISPADFLEKSLGQTLIDVRKPDEFESGHLHGAVNINFYDADFLQQIEKLDPNKPVYLYCRSGGRSGKASVMISELGFKEVFDLKGGVKNWTQNGYKLEK